MAGYWVLESLIGRKPEGAVMQKNIVRQGGSRPANPHSEPYSE